MPPPEQPERHASMYAGLITQVSLVVLMTYTMDLYVTYNFCIW